MVDLNQEKDRLIHKSFTTMFRVALVFAIPALLAFFVGRWLDKLYSIKPWGSVSVLAFTFVLSWAIVIRIYLKLDKEMRELREKKDLEKKIK